MTPRDNELKNYTAENELICPIMSAGWFSNKWAAPPNQYIKCKKNNCPMYDGKKCSFIR